MTIGGDARDRLGLFPAAATEIAESLIGDVMGVAYGDFVQAKVLTPLNTR